MKHLVGIVIVLLIVAVGLYIWKGKSRSTAENLTVQQAWAKTRAAAEIAKSRVGTFSNTLQRRMGMQGAGEHYETPHPGANTVWSGYMKPSVL